MYKIIFIFIAVLAVTMLISVILDNIYTFKCIKRKQYEYDELMRKLNATEQENVYLKQRLELLNDFKNKKD